MNIARLGWATSALGGRLGGQWERERRDTLFLLATIALAALPHAAHLPLWITLAFTAMFGWRLTLVFTGREMPPSWIRTLGAIGCLAGIFAQYHSFIGREQGVAMLTLFLGLKLLEMKARRDLLVVISLCFFLLLTTFFHSQSIVTAMIVLVAVTALIATMITMQFGKQEQAIWSRLRLAAILVLQALPIAIALFVFFPRLATPLWGINGQGSSASTGLSSSMSPGGVSSLSKSTAIAMRVKFDRAIPPKQSLYWRGPVFGLFDGKTWTARSEVGEQPGRAELRVDQSAPPYSYEVTLEPNGQPWLLALDMPSQLAPLTGASASVSAGFSLQQNRPVYERTRYRLDSYLSYTLGLNETNDSLQRWLQLPRGFNPKTLALGRQWSEQMRGQPNQQIARRAMQMFNQQAFTYTLNPPLLGLHSVDDFLFSQQAGFCEHFTSAFVVLMRAAGIPARVVTGYQGGEVNPVDDFMVVRQSDAHAWAEIWTDTRGWIRLDPTSAVAPERIETDQRLLQEQAFGSPGGEQGAWQLLKLNLDALANRWNQWVLNYDRKSQGRLLDKLGFDSHDWTSLAAMLAGAMVLLIGGSALLTLQPRAAPDPLGRLYDQFCEKLAAFGLNRHIHETPAQFLARSCKQLGEEKSEQARAIVRMYTKLRYGEMSGVYQGKERRRRNRVSSAKARHIAQARELMRDLRASIEHFEP